MIRVALVDDHQVTRRGIKTVLELNPDIRVTIEAANGKELLEQLQVGTQPDIAILDINMPEMNGFQTIDLLREQFDSLKIIVFSMIKEEDTVINMINAGACGYISKSADPDTLAVAVMSVFKNGFYLGDLISKEKFLLAKNLKTKAGFNGSHHLTPKELEFISLSASNLNYKEMAEKMEISPKTLENYRDSLFLKLKIKNRAALALYGFKNGLINTYP